MLPDNPGQTKKNLWNVNRNEENQENPIKTTPRRRIAKTKQEHLRNTKEHMRKNNKKAEEQT